VLLSAGGGGGSGGMIFLEAPTVTISGKLTANGGGGGQGGSVSVDGFPGNDGAFSGQQALGGGMGPTAGGSGGSRMGAPTTPTGMVPFAGGGGGAVGVIWLRTHTTPATASTPPSPAPSTDVSL
jgi:hypothetical protein